MMDADIHFGDMQEAAPQLQLRPDRNRHYATAGYESPVEDELPIFIDLDVLRDIEQHAASDTRVELGGVLLGGQYQDDSGKSFVVITDSLRAKHYESTKGSFKFTHDTWSEITRQREEFPDELQMVGWYHTHPDWGVFLSGMDMFICDNFFNRPLDVALVVDPCRGDRAFFQWTGEGGERIRRTGGFYVISSRFRDDELQRYTAQLEGKYDMAHATRFSNAPPQAGSAVVYLNDQRGSWQMPAVLGMLALQLMLLTLIAWRLAAPPAPPQAADADTLAAVQTQLDRIAAQQEAAIAVKAQARLLDALVSQIQGTPNALVDSYQQLQAEKEMLEATVRGQLAREEQLQTSLTAATTAKQNAEAVYKQRLGELERENLEQKAKIKRYVNRLAALSPPEEKSGDDAAEQGDEDPAATVWWRSWPALTAAALALIISFSAVALLASRASRNDVDEESPEPPA